jgi:hypothetical protein
MSAADRSTRTPTASAVPMSISRSTTNVRVPIVRSAGAGTSGASMNANSIVRPARIVAGA